MVVFLWVCVGLTGLMIGSFLNVVVYRVPAGMSVVRPRSRCPVCEAPIGARDNVPVLGWLLLRGKARCCGAPISRRYPLVETATAAVFLGVLAWRGASWTLPAWWWLAAVCLALTLIDIDTHRLPDALTLPSYPVGIVLLGAGLWLDDRTGVAADDAPSPWRVMLRALLGMVIVCGWYWLTWFVANIAYRGEGLGFGDVKLAGILGLYLGSLGWAYLAIGVFAGYLVGGVVGIALMALGKAGRRSKVPFGPFMIVGVWVAAVWGSSIADWYLHAAGL